jgi:hypothetical protein
MRRSRSKKLVVKPLLTAKFISFRRIGEARKPDIAVIDSIPNQSFMVCGDKVCRQSPELSTNSVRLR